MDQVMQNGVVIDPALRQGTRNEIYNDRNTYSPSSSTNQNATLTSYNYGINQVITPHSTSRTKNPRARLEYAHENLARIQSGPSSQNILQIPMDNRQNVARQIQQVQEKASFQNQSSYLGSPISTTNSPNYVNVGGSGPVPNYSNNNSNNIVKNNTSVSSPLPPHRGKRFKMDGSGSKSESIMDNLKKMALSLVNTPLEELLSDKEELRNQEERTKQLIGVIVILQTCVYDPDAAVPRNRIFAKYASVCANNLLKPLGQAAFGKLVKGLFPTITTRRLGTRGQSKYHYCGIKLIDNNIPYFNQTEEQSKSRNATPLVDLPYDYTSQNFDSIFEQSSSEGKNPQSPHDHVEDDEDIQPFYSHIIDMTPKVELSEDFTEVTIKPYIIHPISLTPIEDFLSQNLLESASKESLKTIYEIYSQHCKELIESMRFLHIKKFFQNIESFYQIDSPFIEVLKELLLILLKDNDDSNKKEKEKENRIDDWILTADLQMYKEMLQMLSPLALQIVPGNVISALQSMAGCQMDNLEKIFTTTFNQLQKQNPLITPAIIKKIKTKKLQLAEDFVNLVTGLIRVNETAQAAGKILSNETDVASMINDWTKLVDFNLLLSRELSCFKYGGQKRQLVLHLLQEDVINILKSGIKTPEKDEITIGIDSNLSIGKENEGSETLPSAGNKNLLPSTPSPKKKNTSSALTEVDSNSLNNSRIKTEERAPDFSFQEDVVLHWGKFLTSIPLKFPKIHVKVVLLHINNLITSILREISLSGGSGFGAWWIVRCWIDEWMTWVVDKQFFLQFSIEEENNDNIDEELKTDVSIDERSKPIS